MWHGISRNKNRSTFLPLGWDQLDAMLPHVPLYRTTQDPPITCESKEHPTNMFPPLVMPPVSGLCQPALVAPRYSQQHCCPGKGKKPGIVPR